MSSAGAQEGAVVFGAGHLAHSSAHRVSKSFGGPEELAAGDRAGSPVLGSGRATPARGSKAGSLRSSSSMAERSGGGSRAGSPLEEPNAQAIFKSPRHGNRSGLSVQAFPLSDGSLGGYSSYGGAQSPTHAAAAALHGASPRLSTLSAALGSPRAATPRLAAVATAVGERAVSPAVLDALHGSARLGSPRRPGAVAAVEGSEASAAVAAKEQAVEEKAVITKEEEQQEQPADAGLVAKPEPAADAPVTAVIVATPEAGEEKAPATAISATSGVILAAIRTLSPADSRNSSTGGSATPVSRRPIGAVRCDSRYSELLFRLVQFLPSIKEAAAASTSAAATPWSDQAFEATWELIKAELSSLMAAAKVASQQASRLQILDREVSQLQSVLALIRHQVGTASSGGGAAAAAAAERKLDQVASGLGTGDAAEQPAGKAGEGRRSEGGKSAAAASRSGWGRSVPSQETGLWNSAGPAASNSRGGLSATMPPRPRGPFTSPERVVRTSAGGVTDRRSSRGGALQKPPPTVHPKLSADVAQQLTALYKSAKFQDPDVRGYHVIRTSTTMASDGGRAATTAASAAAPALGAARPEVSLRRLSTGGAGGVLLAGDRPGFAVAKEAFQARFAPLNTRATMPVAALGGNDKWFARLAGRKAATAGEVDGMISKLSKVLAKNDVPLALERLGPFTYAAAGKRLHLREVNGMLLVRTGGGYDELMTVLAKLPCPAVAKA